MAFVNKNFSDIFTFSRTSVARDCDQDGILQEIPAGQIRQGFNPDVYPRTPAGWLLEGSATNHHVDPRAESVNTGLVDQVGGTGWITYVASPSTFGISRTITKGVENGLPYVEMHFVGTPTSTGGGYVLFNASNNTPASVGQVWTGSIYAYMQDGIGGMLGCNLQIVDQGASGGQSASSITLSDVTTGPLNQRRRVLTRTCSVADTTGINLRLSYTFTNGVPVNARLRMACPQFEQNYYASSLILPPVGTPGASTRAADALTVQGTSFHNIWPQRDQRTNLLLWSEQLDNAAWIKSNVGFSTNIAPGPDGTQTAEAITPDTTNAGHNINSAGSFTAGQSCTLSVYAKQGSYSGLRMAFPISPFGSGYQANFDLAAGTIVNAATNVTAVMTAVGSGWYRCSITATATATGNSVVVLFVLQTGDGSQTFAGTGTSGILLWGAQLETAPATLAPNLMAASSAEVFGSFPWLAAGSTIVSDTTADPFGGNAADKIVETTANDFHAVYAQSVAVIAGQDVTVSAYLKSAGRTEARLIVRETANVGNNAATVFNLTAGTVAATAVNGTGINTSSSITSAGNGWWLCRLTARAGASVSTCRIDIGASVNTFAQYVGDGTSGIFAFGANVVSGATAPTYVPLSALVSPYIATTSAPASRFVGTAREGFVIMDVLLPQQAGATNQLLAQIDDGSQNQRFSLRNNSNSANFAALSVSQGNATIASSSLPFAPGTVTRIGMRWGAGVLSACKDGGVVSTSPSGRLPHGLTTLRIGANGQGTEGVNGRIQNVVAGATAPSDAKFQAACVVGADIAAALK
jgi:hypothetical protein